MKRNEHKAIEAILEKSKHSCYVLITCDEPKDVDGEMHVEMSYKGDPTLATYLLEGAQTYIEDQEDEEDILEN